VVEEDKSSLQKTSLSSLDAALTRVNAVRGDVHAFRASPANTCSRAAKNQNRNSFEFLKLLFLNILRPT
jgi:hypothetical protein